MIRKAEKQDAGPLLRLIKQVEAESHYMLLNPYERKTTVSAMDHQIAAFTDRENSAIFVAVQDRKLIGYCLVSGGQVNRNKHSACIVIGVLKAYRGNGIGMALFHTLEQWAKGQKLHRLELTVVTENQAALGLYNKAGFKVEGVKQHALCMDGEFKDEYYMAKLL